MTIEAHKCAFSALVAVNPATDTGDLQPSDEVSFVGMADVSESGWITNREVRALAEVSEGYTCFQEGDILFAKITPCMENGKGAHAIGLRAGIGFGSTEFHVLRPREGTAPRFVYHWSQAPSLRRYAKAFMIGSAGQQRVRQDFFDSFKVACLPLPEQRRIAEILDTVDEAIRKTEEVIAKLEQIKKGLLHDLLTRGIDENGELRDPERHPEEFKDSVVGRIPRGWGVVKVHTLAAGAGSTVIGPFGSNLVAADYRNHGTPVVFVRDVREGYFTWKSNVYVDAAKAQQLAPHAVEPGDIVATKMGLPPCIATVYPDWMPPGIVTADVIRIRVDQALAEPEWVANYINSAAVRRQVRGITGGVTRPKVTLRDFRQIELAVPTLREQQRLMSAVSSHVSIVCKEQALARKLRLLKKGLMDDLLTGRVRVPVEPKEPV